MEHIHRSSRFPDSFLFGASSSAIQVEGALDKDGRGPSVIDTFRMSRDVCDYRDGSDHYHRMQEDVALMKECGLQSYRFSISWTRIFPTGKGKVNPAGVAFYNALIDALVAAGIEPVVTMYHFDYPAGLVAEYGGWVDRRSIDDFVSYAEFLFRTYGDRVRYWLTINEQDHVIRIPPRLGLTGKEPDFNRLRYQANHNMCVASAKVFRLCRELCPGAKIGPALSYQPIYPASSDPRDVLAASDVETLMMNYMCELQVNGVYPVRLWKYLRDRNSQPEIGDGDLALMRENKPDFLGINYYASVTVACQPATKEHPVGRVEGALVPKCEYGIYRGCRNEHLPKTSFGWEIDPVGLRLTLENLYERYRLPLMITENGLSYPDEPEDGQIHDAYRTEYIREHLKQVQAALDTGVEVLGYHVWSFLDLVSGREGYRKRYGLVYVNRDDFDLKDLRRIPKDSFRWYRELIENRTLSSEKES